jgi:cell division protein FtsZ
VVTKPFAFEGKRIKIAEAGIAELQKHVDSLIVILNGRLMDQFGRDASMDNVLRAVDDVLLNTVRSIAEVIGSPGLVNVDLEDMRTIMGEMGMAAMGSATATGIDRARLAAEQAVASPLLGSEFSSARGVLVNITSSRSLRMTEIKEIMHTVRELVDDAHIIFGVVFDEDMEDALRVTVIACGVDFR